MPNLLITNYSFVASSKTVTFTDYASIVKQRIVSVKNLTVGAIIYDREDTSYPGSVATNVLTFTGPNTGMANGDTLLIYYEVDTYSVQSVLDSYNIFMDRGILIKTYTFEASSIAIRVLNSLAIKLGAGTATVSIQINGSNVTGLTGLSITTTLQNFTATALNNVAVGQRIEIVVTAAAGATDLSFTLLNTRS